MQVISFGPLFFQRIDYATVIANHARSHEKIGFPFAFTPVTTLGESDLT
jgi:hypothetical protein